MRLNLPTIAALAAGSYLVARQMKKGRLQDDSFDLEQAMDGTGNSRRGAGLASVAALVAGGLYVSNKLRTGPAGSCTVEQSIDVEVPVRTAYDQWTQFEQFPRFMASVEEVKQVDDTHLHWRAVVGGKPKEWDAEITEQTPDQRIAWRSTSGVTNAGVVTFHRIGDNRTRVMLQMDYEPETVVEKLGDAIGAVKFTAKGNLKKFKKLVEQRGVETGAWRGSVPAH
jgi:uncharacterized membrane protein